MLINLVEKLSVLLNSTFWKRWWWLIALLIFDAFFIMWWQGRNREPVQARMPTSPVQKATPPAQVIQKPTIPKLQIGFPTAQTNLVRREDKTVFMPTVSGRATSAHYGSTRTASSGYASFHEGIDIGPLERDRRGRALDPVLAIADGHVAYINRRVGNSNYGLYVVLEHDDPLGTIYSLYAHMRSVEKELKEGNRISRGTPLGVMGNTPPSIIPVVRSHLHLEVGVIRNRRFDAWAKSEKIKNLHGRYNGWNLMGINPLDIFDSTDRVRPFSMQDYLASLPAAFELVLDLKKPFDYFSRYAALWHAKLPAVGPMVIAVSEGGVILSGRPATENEHKRLIDSKAPVVLTANKDVLGRNGLRLVVESRGQWRLGRNGEKWLDILTY